MGNPLATELEQRGIVLLPNLLTKEQLRGMQEAFAVRLRRMRWNDVDGYEKTESYRHMVQDVLTLDQGFVDLALHPLVTEILGEYLGTQYELVEAKGWKSLPTRTDFHGWHGDAWYDQKQIQDLPREVKLAVYLTDVKSGAFNYIVGTHRRQHPRAVKNSEVQDVPHSRIVELNGPAGTAFMFDTTGIHRQGAPVLEERHAVFLNYHNPDVPLQQEDLDYYRYHPLLLNAAFLGKLSVEDQRVLGFGNKTNYVHAFERHPRHLALQQSFQRLLTAKLHVDYVVQRVTGKLRRTWHAASKQLWPRGQN
jgi:hypothetical protein